MNTSMFSKPPGLNATRSSRKDCLVAPSLQDMCEECFQQTDGTKRLEDGSVYCDSCRPRPSLITCWVPLGDIPVNDGVLAVLPRTTNLPRFLVNGGKFQFPLSYFKHGKNLTWHTSSFKAGDFVLFDAKLVSPSISILCLLI